VGQYPLDELFSRPKVGGSQLGVPFSAVVSESGPNGVWCVRPGEDSRQALGPVRNPDREVIRSIPDGHEHVSERLPKGLPVLVVNSDSGLWVLAIGG
jgi:hypothetical protein